jgi:dTDP-4-dehydrorhamnose 3,5-epimerase
VRALRGTILDVAVDIRKDSPTYGKSFSIELSEENKKQLLIPQGFAHGFSVLTDYAVFSYKCDNLYNPNSERGINFLDPMLNIDWKIDKTKAVVSTKDKVNPSFDDAETNFVYGQI